MKAVINGRPISQAFVDNVIFLNVMPYSSVKKLGKSKQDLIGTNMHMTVFTRDPTTTMGELIVKIIVGPKTYRLHFLW